ncbi:MAG: efflux RND transporter periplasmic adaptor subunit [Proteobacteria bacterium]|nr:efflux RND transporter periplasmic adaptor subunit [Pseudomonadota bacterium]
MKRKVLIIIGIVVLLAIGATVKMALWGNGESQASSGEDNKTQSAEENNAEEVKPANVKVAGVSARDLVEYVTANGTAAAEKDVTVSAEVQGRIEYLGVDFGQQIKKGKVLARIDFRSLRAQKESADSNYTLAKATHGRLSELGEDLVSKQKLDEVTFAMTGAKAQLDVAATNLEKSTLRSVLDGIVSGKFVDEGEYVSPGTPMFRIINYKTIIIEAQLAETQVSKIAPGGVVDVYVDALDKSFTGTVDTILPAADSESKTFTARIKVDNPDLKIMVGMSASLKITSKVHENAVVVSQDSVVENKDSRCVYVVADGVAERREVVLGSVQDDKVLIVDGLKPGDELIVLGHRDLYDGQSINVIP